MHLNRIAIKLTLLLFAVTLFPLFAGTGLITTVAGNGTRGYGGLGGLATNASLGTPGGICFDSAGNLYIADYGNQDVVRVDAVTGIMTLVAGTGQYTSTGDGGPASFSNLNGPMGVAIDAAGNLFISEYWGNRVRRVDAQTHIITTVAGNGSATPSGDNGPGSSAGIQAPRGLATDAAGNLYIAETNDIRRVDAATGIITTAVPYGAGGVSNPTWIAFDGSGNLLIHDAGVSLIQRFNPSTRILDTFAGNGLGGFDGDGKQARITGISGFAIGIAVDPSGNVYLSTGNVYSNDNQSRLRRIDAVTGLVQTIAGNGYPFNANTYPYTPSPDGQPANLTQITPVSVAVGPDGSVYFADDVRVRRVSLPSPWTYTSTTLTVTPPNPAHGANVTFTATPVAINGTGVPTGTVSLFDTTYGMSPFGTPLPVVNGIASITLQVPNSGDFNMKLVASYSGDSANAASVSPMAPMIVGGPSQVATHVTFSSSGNPAPPGTPVNIQATILTQYPSAYTPTGSLQVTDNGGTVLTVPVAGTTVLFSLSLATGTHQIAAVYSGDSHFLSGGSDVLTQVIGKVTPTVTISSSVNPAIIGGPLTFTATVSPAGATGQVDFVEYVAPAVGVWGTVPVVNGIATLTFAALPAGASAGTHYIQANYNGDSAFNSASSASLAQQVAKASSVVSLSSTMNPGVTGVQIAITATVSAPIGPLGQPSGTVQLMDGATSLGTVTLQSGQAQFMASFDTGGTHMLTAVYSGDRAFNSATSSPLSEVVKSTVGFSAVTTTPNPSVIGSPVLFTAYIVQTSATGTVEFLDASVSLGVANLSNGVASLTTSSLTAGTRSITVRYSGDANFMSASTSVTQVVKTSSTLNLAATPATAVYGDAVQLTANVAPAAATGTVQFSDGATALGTSAVNSGVAVLSVPSFTAGTHSLTATYNGDSAYAGSASPAVAVTINKATPTLSISSAQNPSPGGQALVFTIVLTPVGASGAVQLLDGATVVATLTAGTASASVTLATGSHTVTAVYSGDSNFTGATSAAVSQLITTATTTSLIANPASSNFGQTVQLTATVTPAPTSGAVTFLDGAVALGSAPLAGGVASLSVSTLAAGSHSIVASYAGDGAAYLASTSAVLSESVAKAATTATLTSSVNPANVGQSVALTATVSPAAATGIVQFFDGAASLGAATLAGGAASLSTSALIAGAHALTVVYSGDTNYSASTSAALSESVAKAATTATLTSSVNPATFGQSVALTATVSPAAATGIVQFFDGAASLGAATLAGGAASLSTSALIAGAHALTVVYSGDTNYSASTSAALSESVAKAATIATLTSSVNPSNVGQSVTFTASISPATATGTIQFMDGTTTLGAITVSGGTASLAVATLTAGSHTVSAIYSGAANYLGGTSAAVMQSVVVPIPGAPTNLTAIAPTFAQINLTWTASPTGGVTYNVYSSATSGFIPSTSNRIATGLTSAAYSHTGLTANSTHYYVVKAQNSAGESAASNQAVATTQASGISCHVGYSVDTQSKNGFSAAITIKNNLNAAINGWNLTWIWAGDQQITHAVNSNYSQTGQNVSLTNVAGNAAIGDGQTLNGISFSASYSGKNTAPTAFYVNGILCK